MGKEAAAAERDDAQPMTLQAFAASRRPDRNSAQRLHSDLGINLPSENPLYWGVPNINITALSGLGEESDAPFINSTSSPLR